MVFYGILARASVGLTFLAAIHPRKWRFDAIGRVVCKGKAYRSGRGNRQQVAVADSLLSDGKLKRLRQAAGERARRQIGVGIELREGAFFSSKRYGSLIGGIAQFLGNARGHFAALMRVIAQAQHRQCVTHSGKADTNAAFCHGFFALLR